MPTAQTELNCSNCTIQACRTENSPGSPAFCPTKTHKRELNSALGLYIRDGEIRKIALAATRTMTQSLQMKWTRVEDTIDFAQRMGYQKIGIATCIGLITESRILTKILEVKGFKVISVCCKCGAIPKEKIGIPDSEMRNPGKFEAICNPVAQAKMLNKDKSELNIMVGLCVGHDSLFLKHSKAPVTVLIAKDRITCHNPAAVLHGTSSYYKRLLSA